MPRETRNTLTELADLLAARDARVFDEPEYANTIRAVLEPGGWTMLRSQTGKAAATENVSLTLGQVIKTELVEAAERTDTTLSHLAAEAYRAFLAGNFTPPAPSRPRRGAAGPSVPLNVRVPSDLRAQVRQRIAEEKAAGRPTNESTLLQTYMAAELGVDLRRGAADAE